MNASLRTALAACTLAACPAIAQVTFFEHEGYEGRSFTTERLVGNFNDYGFNDRASSVVVAHDRWEVCQDARFSGRCVVLRPGSYSSLSALGLNDRISSVRAVSDKNLAPDRYAPGAPQDYYDARQRRNERLFEANVTSARAVFGAAERRCWVERETVSQERGSANVPGAIAGALIGGILGHQVGGGSGRDIATVGGVVAGAAVGSNVGRNGAGSRTQDVQRCQDSAHTGPPQYWDVGYNFRGVEHHVQMRSRPGPTVKVNRRGEPRA